MGSQHCKHDSVMQTKPSNKRCATCPVIYEEPSRAELSEPSLDASSPVQHEIEEVQSVPPTPLDPTILEEIETPALVNSDPLIPDPLTPDPVAPNPSIWATFRRYLFGVSMRKGGKGKDHGDHHRPEPKEEEEKPTDEFSPGMAAKRNNKKPQCRYGTHRRLDQPGDDVKNKVCKFHKSRKGEDKKEDDCQ